MMPDMIAAYCAECATPMLGKPASGRCILCEIDAMPNDPTPPRGRDPGSHPPPRRACKATLRGYRP